MTLKLLPTSEDTLSDDEIPLGAWHWPSSGLPVWSFTKPGPLVRLVVLLRSGAYWQKANKEEYRKQWNKYQKDKKHDKPHR